MALSNIISPLILFPFKLFLVLNFFFRQQNIHISIEVEEVSEIHLGTRLILSTMETVTSPQSRPCPARRSTDELGCRLPSPPNRIQVDRDTIHCPPGCYQPLSYKGIDKCSQFVHGEIRTLMGTMHPQALTTPPQHLVWTLILRTNNSIIKIQNQYIFRLCRLPYIVARQARNRHTKYQKKNIIILIIYFLNTKVDLNQLLK